MNYSNMITNDNLKKTFIVATLISTIIGTFTTGIGLYERVGEKVKQNKRDTGQDTKIKELQKRIDEVGKEKEQHKSRADDLHNSLSQGGPMIKREYSRDFDRLGPRFAEGDDITQNQLQGQVITLQGTVIHLLEDALYTGRMGNVNKLYNASEFAREGSIRALQDQYQRMLQAAPLRRPVGPVRRISSTPDINGRPYALVVRAGDKKSARGTGRESSRGVGKATSRIREEREIGSHRDSVAGSRNGSTTKETSASNMPPVGGALFCNYALDLQSSSRMDLDDRCFGPGCHNACPTCGTIVLIQEGRAWRIDKTVSKGKRTTEEFDEELYEQKTYLVENRFIVKCHREQAGFACALCARSRDYDTVCSDAAGLVKHLWKKHEVEEFDEDEDITELSLFEKKVKTRY